jgi:aminopeptidase YwaD
MSSTRIYVWQELLYLRNPNYHQPTDTLDTLDLDFMTGICHGLQAGIDRL